MRRWFALGVLVAAFVAACGARSGLSPGSVDNTEGSSAGGLAGAMAQGGGRPVTTGGSMSVAGRAGSGGGGVTNAGGVASIAGEAGVGGSAQAGQGPIDDSPEPPRLVAPLSTSTVTSQTPRLAWQLGSGSDAAEIEICRDRACTDSVTTFRVTGDAGSVPKKLAAGVYYWRGRGVLGNVFGQRTSAVWEFWVGAASAAVDTAWGSMLDVNGDGFADVLVGAYRADPKQSGAAFLYLGGVNGLSTTPLTISAPDTNGEFGAKVASAGDVNGDGFADVLIGALSDNSDAGAVYVYLGGPFGLGSTPIKLTSPDTPGDNFSYQLASAGDVNGDGYADVVVSALFRAGIPGRYIFYGGQDGPISPPSRIDLPDGLTSPFTGAVAGAGDLNGDGLGDVVIGVTDISHGGGEAYVYLGTVDGLSTTPVTLKSPVGPNLGFAPSAACAGDVNGDGYADLIIGSQTEAATPGDGNAYLYLGSAAGVTTTPISVPIPGGPNGGYGYFVSSAGDLNGDGCADVVIGAPGAQVNIGFADVYLGSSAGLGTPVTILGPDEFYFGIGLAAVGDVNNDGFADVAITGSGGLVKPGVVAIYLGGATGVGSVPLQLVNDQLGSQFGTAVASAAGVWQHAHLKRGGA